MKLIAVLGEGSDETFDDQVRSFIMFAMQAAQRFPGPPGRLRFTLRLNSDLITFVCRTDGTLESVVTVQMTDAG